MLLDPSDMFKPEEREFTSDLDAYRCHKRYEHPSIDEILTQLGVREEACPFAPALIYEIYER